MLKKFDNFDNFYFYFVKKNKTVIFSIKELVVAVVSEDETVVAMKPDSLHNVIVYEPEAI